MSRAHVPEADLEVLDHLESQRGSKDLIASGGLVALLADARWVVHRLPPLDGTATQICPMLI